LLPGAACANTVSHLNSIAGTRHKRGRPERERVPFMLPVAVGTVDSRAVASEAASVRLGR
jgi:hypothetical protein